MAIRSFDVFNRYGGLVGPDEAISAVVYPRRGIARVRARGDYSSGWPTFLGCRAARAKHLKGVRLPYRCHRTSGEENGATELDDGSEVPEGAAGAGLPADEPPPKSGARWVLGLDDGNAYNVLEALKGRWNRWTHEAKQGVPLAEYFPQAPFMFSSPSVINMYAADLVLADGALDAAMANPRAGAAQLADGRTDLSGPRCLVRRLCDTVHEAVLSTVVEALQPTAGTQQPVGKGRPLSGAPTGSDALLVGLHIRRGDAAMQDECTDCVNGDDPDVKARFERISAQGMEREIGCVNRSLVAIEHALEAAGSPRPVRVFVASDTALGSTKAVAILGAERVLAVTGRAVHSTRELAQAAFAEGAGLKVAADFVALTLADVHLGIGDSSFLGNAAAAGLTEVVRVSQRVASGDVCRALEERELRKIVEAMKTTPGTVEAMAESRTPHVEL